MTPSGRRLTASLAMAFAAVFLLKAFGPTARTAGDDDDRAEAIASASHVVVRDGRTIVTLDAAMQARLGVAVGPLRPAAIRPTVSAPGLVLSVQSLIAARETFVASQFALRRARIVATAARQEFDRLNRLYHQRQNASLKARQAAHAALRTDELDVDEARQALALKSAAVRQRWGPVVERWLTAGSPDLQRVIDRDDLLIQVSLPPGGDLSPGRVVAVALPGGEHASARFVSAFPRVDPRVQGLSFLYVMAARAGLAGGTTLVVEMPAGRIERGVTVPDRAVVSWQGRSWVYQELAPGQFARRPVTAGQPLAGSLLVTRGFTPGTPVVLVGAEALLSEEFRAQIQPEG